MEIDLTKVKAEPVEDIDAFALETCLQGGRSSSGCNQDLAPKRTKSRVRCNFRKSNYLQPQSTVCEVCQAEFSGKGIL